MAQQQWLIDESSFPDTNTIEQKVEREINLKPSTRGGRESLEELPNLAIRIQDIMIWDTKKWFGDAEIRLDALVVHGNAIVDNPQSIYMPQTFRFPAVKDKDRLPTGETGLLIFYGQPQYFLDIFILVSRDRKDSDDLATLLSQQLNSVEIRESLAALLGLALVAPQAAAIVSAVGSASVLGNFAYQVLSRVTGNTIGLYRNSWLQHTDNFGIGRHPHQGSHKVKDLSFFYEIVQE
ncbi:MAG: hypothetical protein QNJ32_12660 [Xenococcaceae cyanobacterium MO_167.B27]|nr:hypothetical protein [Xenococcaceae cyanobacterium MO_167.B27]